MTRLNEIGNQAADRGLRILGIAPLEPVDGLPDRLRSLVLLGPDEPRFWDVFQASDEARDGLANPLDRWSRRVIGRIACDGGGKAYFPFGGPPWRPFLDWALRSGRCWPSPVGLLVHEEMGLFVSYRGAIGIEEEYPAEKGIRPCDTCEDRPCIDACPAGALGAEGYDVPSCKAWIGSAPGAVCLTGGCLVRRSCPIGAGKRPPAQSAFHMEAFKGP